MINNNFENAFGKKYNIEWYLANGKVMTTSAVLVDGRFECLYFEYSNGGLFVVERRAIRSMECMEG